MKNIAISMIILMLLGSIPGYSQIPQSRIEKETHSSLEILYKEKIFKLTENQKKSVHKIIEDSEKEIRLLLPVLPKNLRVIVSVTDENVDRIGGVNGRTESNSPAEVIVEISNVFPGGVSAAIKNALSTIIFHEFHHLSRGWAIKDNKFGRGISIATVNEGLAVVFAEKYTGVELEGYKFPPMGIESWAKEILPLPKDASYTVWMSEHPDGRSAIGYRAGKFIVQQAIAKSGKNVLELSKLSPDKILKLASIN